MSSSSTSLAEIMLPEFDREMARTRRILAAVTVDILEKKVHESLHTIAWNAGHIVEVVGWTPYITNYPEFDMSPIDGPKYEAPVARDPAKLMADFDKNVTEARTGLAKMTDAAMAEPWSLKAAGQTYFTMPKGECLRTWVLNHLVHHRAILAVYLRMLGINVTPPYDQ
jgi:uncharacterized damage-inducible protein DinB